MFRKHAPGQTDFHIGTSDGRIGFMVSAYQRHWLDAESNTIEIFFHGDERMAVAYPKLKEAEAAAKELRDLLDWAIAIREEELGKIRLAQAKGED